MEIEASVRSEDSYFLFGERGQGCVGAKRREDLSSIKREQSATPKQLEILAQLLGVHII